MLRQDFLKYKPDDTDQLKKRQWIVTEQNINSPAWQTRLLKICPTQFCLASPIPTLAFCEVLSHLTEHSLPHMDQTPPVFVFLLSDLLCCDPTKSHGHNFPL